MVKTNRELLTGGEKYASKKQKKHRVEEVKFDKDARVEYLTGFHKRKLQRQKKAQEFYKEQERLAKIEERKKIKQERQADIENQLKKFKETVTEIAQFNENLNESEDEESEEFKAFSDNEDEEDKDEKDEEINRKGILRHKEVYTMDKDAQLEDGAVIDEETTVVVESMENPSILNAQKNLQELIKKNNVDINKSEEVLDESIKRAKNYAVLCGVAKPKNDKQKKKKFRYLSKSERRAKNRKDKINSASYKARASRDKK